GIDFSDAASRALERAIVLAREHGAALHVVHTQRAAKIGFRLNESEGRGGLDEALERARAGGAEAHAHLRVGELLDVIEGVADESGAELVVLGAGHGRKAATLVTRGKRDVLVVKTTTERGPYRRAVAAVLASTSSAPRVITTTAKLAPTAHLS